MRICIESSVLDHRRRSGLMTYGEGLVNSLFENDRLNDYTLAYYSLSRKAENMPGPSGENFRKEVFKVPDREFFKRQYFIDRFVLPKFFKTQQIDIFHRPAGYTMPLVKDVFKIMTVHDLRTLTIGDRFCVQNIGDYQTTMDSLDACVVVSECTKQDVLKHFKIDEKKIKVIYLGADKRFQPASQESIEETLNKYHLDEPFLLSLGSVPRKNIDGIIRGFAAAGSIKKTLLVLGCNMDVPKYAHLAETLGVLGRVRFLERLGDDEIVALYSSCKAFVFPSLYEGFGLPILEAMQCGAPVITSNISSCPEVAGDSAMIVDPHHYQELGSAIDTISTDTSYRNDLIQKGFKRAKLFSWDNFAQEMKKVYALAQ